MCMCCVLVEISLVDPALKERCPQKWPPTGGAGGEVWQAGRHRQCQSRSRQLHSDRWNGRQTKHRLGSVFPPASRSLEVPQVNQTGSPVTCRWLQVGQRHPLTSGVSPSYSSQLCQETTSLLVYQCRNYLPALCFSFFFFFHFFFISWRLLFFCILSAKD